MNSRTIEFDYGSYLVEVEATQDGKVLQATISIDHMDPVDCTQKFKNSDWCMKELFKRIDDIDWNDDGGDSWALDILKEGLRPQ